MIRSMPHRLPLSALLSFALVSFTVEADNESERRIPHRTARYGAGLGGGPWLISMVMWFNCLRWIPEQGIAAGEVERLARTRTNWDGMRRWGHLCFEPPPGEKDRKLPHPATIVRLTPRGRVGRDAWRTLIPEIERRWRERFGAVAMEALRNALIGLAGHLDPELPDCMPILRYGLVSEKQKAAKPGGGPAALAELPLPSLLARLLLAFELEFNRESTVSLAICADVLRVIDDEGTAVRNLPELSGVSKEAFAMALSFLSHRGCAVVEPDPGKRTGKRARLTPKGILAKSTYGTLAAIIERRWDERFGMAVMERLRQCLESLTGDGTAERSPLFAGLEPGPECWRSKVPRPATLPHYPMVLHRGGYPDGS